MTALFIRRLLGSALSVGLLAAGATQAQDKSIGFTSDPSHPFPLAGEEMSFNIMY